MTLSEAHAFLTPSPDEDKDIWVVPLDIVAKLEKVEANWRQTAIDRGVVIAELQQQVEGLKRNVYWSRMELQGQYVAWNGEFRFDHEKGLAWFLNKAQSSCDEAEG